MGRHIFPVGVTPTTTSICAVLWSQADGEQVEEATIFVELAERLGMIPDYPSKLRELAGDRLRFRPCAYGIHPRQSKGRAVVALHFGEDPGGGTGIQKSGRALGTAGAVPNDAREDVARAGYQVGPLTGEEIFKKILNTPGGVKIGVVDTENNLSLLKTPDKKIHIHFPEMESWVKEVTPAAEEAQLVNKDYPMVLMAGNHMEMVANTIMRDPAWNEGRRPCTMRIHPADAEELGIADGRPAFVETEAGSAMVEAEVTDSSHRGQVVIPHGFGLIHLGEVHGVNVNRLAPAKTPRPSGGHAAAPLYPLPGAKSFLDFQKRLETLPPHHRKLVIA